MIMPKHGVCVSGPTLYGAYSMLERIEADAFCNLAKAVMWPDIAVSQEKRLTERIHEIRRIRPRRLQRQAL